MNVRLNTPSLIKNVTLMLVTKMKVTVVHAMLKTKHVKLALPNIN